MVFSDDSLLLVCHLDLYHMVLSIDCGGRGIPAQLINRFRKQFAIYAQFISSFLCSLLALANYLNIQQ